MNSLPQLASVAIVLFSLACLGGTKRGQPPYVNDRSLMRGARCQILDWNDKQRPQHEEVFGEVKSVTISKTVHAEEWVLRFSDFNNCTLSFWTETANPEGVPNIVRSISAY